jgi:hypothetical protein
VFEKSEGDMERHEYALVTGSSPGDLEKKARARLAEGFVPVAINNEDDTVAVFERTPGAGTWKILSTRSTSTMEKELSAAAAEGYRVTAAAGGSELVYAVVKPPDATPVEYRLLATTSSETLERELNDAAAAGFRFVPSSLAALAASTTLFVTRMSNEAAIVVEKAPGAPPVTYRIVGARRTATIERETREVAGAGYRILAALLGYEETVVILASEARTITTR